MAQFDREASRVERRNARHASRATTTLRRFVQDVAESGNFSIDDAERYTIAVIATLEERLPIADVSGLEAQLPLFLREALGRQPILDLPQMDERLLVKRVALRLGAIPEEAERIVRAVFGVLTLHLSPGEATHIESRLSPDLRSLWRKARAEA